MPCNTVAGTWPYPTPAPTSLRSGVALPSNGNLALPAATLLVILDSIIVSPHTHSLISLLLKDLKYAPR